MSVSAFRHITKSSSAAVCTRRRLANTSTCLVRTAAEDDFVICRKRTYGHVLVLPSRHLVHTAAEDDFVICRNARMDMCLYYQVDV